MDSNNPHTKDQRPTKIEAEEKNPVDFDPSRMVGIIKRKALIKDLAAAYHAECVACCQELLQLQKKWEEQQRAEKRIQADVRKQIMKSAKRQKKGM